MDLNAFVFRDDTAESLGFSPTDADETDDSKTDHGSARPGIRFAAIGGAALGLAGFIGHITKHL